MRASEGIALRSVLLSSGPARGLFGATLRRDKNLQDLCARGGAVFRPFSDLLLDVFAFFHEPSASVNASAGACDKLHHLVMKYLAGAPEYTALRSRTRGSYEQSLAAAEEFGNRLLQHMAGEAARAKAEGRRGSGQGGEVVEVEELILADVARAGAGECASPGVLVLAKRVEEALDTAELLADICQTFGVSPGEMRATPWQHRADLASRMGKSGNLRRFAELLGRWTSLATARRAKKTLGVPEEFSDVTYGDDWNLFVPQELGALADESLRYDFFLRLIDRKILQYDPQCREGGGRGPIVVCVDTSGSMAGLRDVAAKAATLSLQAIARKECRPFAVVLFSSPGEWLSFRFGTQSVLSRKASGEESRLSLLDGIMNVATFFFGGGTDYESPLLEAQRLIDNGGAEWRDGDIVFITDDYCEVSDDFLTRFRGEKQRLGFRVFSVIVGAGSKDVRTLRKFSDRVLSATDFDENAAEQIFDAV